MLTVTRDLVLPTTMTGSYPKPQWNNFDLQGRPFKVAMGHTPFREQYLDTVASVIAEQCSAGLDIVTDGDARFDMTVGGKSWMFYLLERLGGLTGRRDLAPNWSSSDFSIRPGHILYEVMEASQAPVITSDLRHGPLEYSAIWKSAQRLSERPVKFGTISAQCLVRMMWNEFYPSEREMILALSDIMNEELRELAHSGCRLIQVEEPRHHLASLARATTEADFEFFTQAFNREVKGVEAEIWVHTCWGNPAQQRLFSPVPSYERVLPYLFSLHADVITFECASSGGKDLPLIGKMASNKKVAIGVVNHTTTIVESPNEVAALIRKALEYIPPERLIISTDCGFGREGLSRRIAFFKCVALVQGTNVVRREARLGRGTNPCGQSAVLLCSDLPLSQLLRQDDERQMTIPSVSEKKLAVDIEGTGEPVIMLHGLGGTTNVWGAQAKRLATKFKVIRFDLEGSGRSPAASTLSVQGWVEDLASLMHQEGLTSARIVAHSLGTLISQHFAATYPDRVVRLALFGVNRAPTNDRRQALRDRAAKVRAGGLEVIVDSVVSAGTSPQARTANPLIEAFARELMLRQSAEGYARSCEAVAAAVPADLSRIACPVLLVAGAEDSVSPPQISTDIAPALRDAKVVLLERCGHWLPIESPDEVTRELMAFL